ncbi:tripartite tricarboxylate transporter TctB family protein [Ancylobacter terrae]|uniref:tripartite tricarboxylate transporter TctB family protein n=1 Tax=Ancylobacter sp. sgz301288 TaxID=3342077 RepID=UPI00385F008F
MIPDARRRRSLVAASVVTAMGAVATLQAAAIPHSPIGGQVDSAAFPYAIGVGMILCGLLLAGQARRGGWECLVHDPEAGALHRPALVWILLAYALTLAALALSGSFILAATLLFCFAVRAFRRGLWVPSVFMGLAAATATYVLFSIGLGLQIGEGLPERTLEWAIRF